MARRRRPRRLPGPPVPAGRTAGGVAAMRTPYEYAIIQAVPRIERGELINVGVVLYSQRLDFLAARTHLHEDRLRALDPEVDVPAVAAALASWSATCAGAGAAAGMKPGERFRWLVAPRS